MRFEVEGPPFANEGDEIVIHDAIRRGDVVWFDRIAPQEVVMRIAEGVVKGPCYRIDRGAEPDVFRLVALEQDRASP